MSDGAVPGGGIDAPVAGHYGSPSREQRALVDGRALVDLSHYETIRLSGPDRHQLLHNLSTQAFTGITPGTSTETLFLSADGKIEAGAAVYEAEDHTFLIAEPGGAQWIVDFLTKMRFMLRVDIEIIEMTLLGGYGDGDLPNAVIWRDPWPTVSPDSVAYGPHRDVPQAFIALVDSDKEAFLDEWLKHGSMAGTLAWHAQRVANWRPSIRDIDEKSLPHEFDWLRTAVHLDKGCYRGQEAVARIVNLGRPPRRLVFCHIDGSEDRLPEDKTLYLGEKAVGTLRAVARDMDEGVIGLALIKRNVAEDAEIVIDGLPVSLETIVDPSGKTTRSYERPRLK